MKCCLKSSVGNFGVASFQSWHLRALSKGGNEGMTRGNYAKICGIVREMRLRNCENTPPPLRWHVIDWGPASGARWHLWAPDKAIKGQPCLEDQLSLGGGYARKCGPHNLPEPSKMGGHFISKTGNAEIM